MKNKSWLLLGVVSLILLFIVNCASKPHPGTQDSASTAPPTVAPPDKPMGDNATAGQKPPPSNVKPPADDEILESTLAALKKGNLAYSPPVKMKTQQTERVVARIAGEKVSVQTLENGLPTGANRKVETAATPVASAMRMTLKGADFDITPLSTEEQIVAGDQPTTWEWDVIAKHSGKLSLHLAAIVVLKQLSRDFVAIDRDVTVQVDPVDAITGFIKENWQWIIATLTTVGGATWKFLRDRKKKTNEPPPPIAKGASA